MKIGRSFFLNKFACLYSSIFDRLLLLFGLCLKWHSFMCIDETVLLRTSRKERASSSFQHYIYLSMSSFSSSLLKFVGVFLMIITSNTNRTSRQTKQARQNESNKWSSWKMDNGARLMMILVHFFFIDRIQYAIYYFIWS